MRTQGSGILCGEVGLMIRLRQGFARRIATIPRSGQVCRIVTVLAWVLALCCASGAQGQGQSAGSAESQKVSLLKDGVLALPSRGQTIVFRLEIPPENQGKNYKIIAMEYNPVLMSLSFTNKNVNGRAAGRWLPTGVVHSDTPLIFGQALELQLEPSSDFPKDDPVPLAFAYRLDGTSSSTTPESKMTIQVQVAPPDSGSVGGSGPQSNGGRSAAGEGATSGDSGQRPGASTHVQAGSTSGKSPGSQMGIFWFLLQTVVTAFLTIVFLLLIGVIPRLRRVLDGQLLTEMEGLKTRMPGRDTPPAWFTPFTNWSMRFDSQMQQLAELAQLPGKVHSTIDANVASFLRRQEETRTQDSQNTHALQESLQKQQAVLIASVRADTADQYAAQKADIEEIRSLLDAIQQRTIIETLARQTATLQDLRSTMETQTTVLQRLRGEVISFESQLAGQERLLDYYREELATHSILTRLCTYAEELSMPIAAELEAMTQVLVHELFGNTSVRAEEIDLEPQAAMLTGVADILQRLRTSADMPADVTLIVRRAQDKCRQLTEGLEDLQKAMADGRTVIPVPVQRQWREPSRLLKEVTDSMRRGAVHLHDPQPYFIAQIEAFVINELIAVIDACDGLTQSQQLRELVQELIRYVGLQDTSPRIGEPLKGQEHTPIAYEPGTGGGDSIARVTRRGFMYHGREISKPQVVVKQ